MLVMSMEKEEAIRVFLKEESDCDNIITFSYLLKRIKIFEKQMVN